MVGNDEKIVTVVKIERFKRSELPMPLEKVKHIISKYSEPEEASVIEHTVEAKAKKKSEEYSAIEQTAEAKAEKKSEEYSVVEQIAEAKAEKKSEEASVIEQTAEAKAEKKSEEDSVIEQMVDAIAGKRKTSELSSPLEREKEDETRRRLAGRAMEYFMFLDDDDDV